MIQFQLRGARRLSLCLAAALAVRVQAQTPRLRVAVYPFTQSAVESVLQKEGIGNVNYGQVAADLLVSQLVSQADVINRDQMQRLLEEQGRRYDERFDPSQAPEFGKLMGVDAIVSGSMTSLTAEQSNSSGAGGLANAFGGILGRKLPKTSTDNTTVTVRVQLVADVISTITGKILASYRGDGEVKKQIAGKIQVNDQGKTDTSSSKSGYDPYIREALQIAVTAIGKNFSTVYADAPRASNKPPEPTANPEYVALPGEIGNVFRADGDTLTFFLAPGATIVSGDVLEVQHPEIARNPRTGRTTAIGQPLGQLKVTQVSGETGRGSYHGKSATDQDRLVKSETAAPAPNQRPSPAK